MRIAASTLALALVAGLGIGKTLAGTQASASVSSGSGTYYPYQYNLTLHNTGDTDIATFWFAWDDSGLNFLPSYPDYINAPSGWYAVLTDNYGVSDTTGYAIEWYGYGTALAPGQSLSGFSFESYDSPAVVGGVSPVPPINPGDAPFPVGTSFVYDTYPAEQDPGFQFVAGAAAAAPEPGTLAALGAGLFGLLLRRRRI